MLNFSFFAFYCLLLVLGLRRPFIWVLAYIYVDILAPQVIVPWGLIASMQISMVLFVLSVVGWATSRGQSNLLTMRQVLILILLCYCGVTTMYADFPIAAADKWSWVWKALVFAFFMSLTLCTRLRIEATVLVMVLTASAITIDGAIKTLIGGGGYGVLHLFVDNNTNMYESSTLSAVAVSMIPLIVWLARFGTIFPPRWWVTLFAIGLILSCALIPIGTAARTGLICMGLLSVLTLRSVKRRGLYILGMVVMVAIAVPFLPASYTQRMNTINHANSDESASTRVAVWTWTIEFAKKHPFGGGFNAYLSNEIHLHIADTSQNSGTSASSTQMMDVYDHARAYHSSYFEMLGEQGWPGLGLWLVLQFSGIIQLEGVRRRLRYSEDPKDRSDMALATALQEGQIVYLVGAAFVGIAFQPFIFMLIGLQIGLADLLRYRTKVPKPVKRRASGRVDRVLQPRFQQIRQAEHIR